MTYHSRKGPDVYGLMQDGRGGAPRMKTSSLVEIVYELVDAYAGTADLDSELVVDVDWLARCANRHAAAAYRTRSRAQQQANPTQHKAS